MAETIPMADDLSFAVADHLVAFAGLTVFTLGLVSVGYAYRLATSNACASPGRATVALACGAAAVGICACQADSFFKDVGIQQLADSPLMAIFAVLGCCTAIAAGYILPGAP